MLDYKVVIPARLKSTRLPNKPLINLRGKSMLLRTYEQCLKVINSKHVYVATDNELIKAHCEKYNINCILTSENCLTGTDRIVEFSEKVKADWYINVQGDEPVFNPNDLKKLLEYINSDYPKKGIYNGYTPIVSSSEFKNLNVPKVVFSKSKHLLYMSRAGIPCGKNNKFDFGYRQVCLYGFSKEILNNFPKKKSKLENKEDIEILRFLEDDYIVQMVEMSGDSHPIDVKEDIKIVENIIDERKL